MSRNRTPLPPELRDFLRDDADEADAGASLSAVWHLLDAADGDTNASPLSSDAKPLDVDAAWEAVRQRTFGDPRPLQSARDQNPTRGEAEPGSRPGADRDATSTDRAMQSRSGRTQRSRSRSHRSRRSAWVGAVAAVLIAVVGAAVWWTQPVVVSAPAGAQITATLPDGSTAQLNSGTTLSYDRGFAFLPGLDAETRTVTLEGEAFFTVTHQDRPFTVQTFNSRINVLGTEFNVRARPAEGGATDVVVASGRVRVQQNTPTAPDGVVLSQPGQRSRVTDSVATASVVDVSRTLAWRSRGFAVTDQPLAVVVRELERRYDLTLRLSEEARTRGGSLSLYYARPADAETIIHDLCTARGLSYRPTTNGYEIFVDTNS